MNYGYNNQTPGWKEGRSDKLARKLRVLCLKFLDSHKMHPYVEINGLYEGVRIRRITHLADDEMEKLIDQADAIYKEVMK